MKELLKNNHYYHIYNRGINGCTIFSNEKNMDYFIKLTGKYLLNNSKIVSFCLMNNHFHFVIKIEDENSITKALSNLFNAYAKAYNKQQNRTGSLFEKHFKRKLINTDEYLKTVLLYIHNNPIHNVELYKYSS